MGKPDPRQRLARELRATLTRSSVVMAQCYPAVVRLRDNVGGLMRLWNHLSRVVHAPPYVRLMTTDGFMPRVVRQKLR